MFYSPELLSMRRKGKLSRCWLAATLSIRLFKKTVNVKTVLSIDIQMTCNEILKFLSTDSVNKKFRFSLYTSSILTYGTVRLLSMQVILFRDSLYRIQMDVNPIDLMPKRKKKTGEVLIDEITLAEPPPVNFRGVHVGPDLHLLPEVDIENVKKFKTRDFVECPDFGVLTEDQLDIFLVNGGDIRSMLSPDGQARTIDESRDQHRSLGYNKTDLHNLGVSNALTMIDEASVAEKSAKLLRTPQKRLSTATNFDTPSKRLRRGLGEEIDRTVEPRITDILNEVPMLPMNVQVPPLDTFAEVSTDVAAQPVDDSARLPTEDPAVSAHPAEEITGDVTAPADSHIHLKTLDLETTIPGKSGRKRKVKFLDTNTQLFVSEIGKTQFANINKYTIPFVPPVQDRKRGVLAAALLVNPTTNRRRHYAADSAKWADKLIDNFKTCTTGPFVAENDDSTIAEALRLAESAIHPAEISNSPRNAADLEASSRNKTVDPILVDVNIRAETMIPDVTADVPEEPMVIDLPDITNEPILPAISETTTESIAKLRQTDLRVTATANETSDTNTGDIDAFLPRQLRRASVEKKTSHGKVASPVAIIDIHDSPVSVRSQQSNWTAPELLAYLEILWHDRRLVDLQDLLPPETTKRIDAAVCFTLLLKLSKNRKIVLTQKETFGRIYIAKMTMVKRSMDWNEA